MRPVGRIEWSRLPLQALQRFAILVEQVAFVAIEAHRDIVADRDHHVAGCMNGDFLAVRPIQLKKGVCAKPFYIVNPPGNAGIALIARAQRLGADA